MRRAQGAVRFRVGSRTLRVCGGSSGAPNLIHKIEASYHPLHVGAASPSPGLKLRITITTMLTFMPKASAHNHDHHDHNHDDDDDNDNYYYNHNFPRALRGLYRNYQEP